MIRGRQDAIITHGRLVSPNRVELDQPVAGIQGEVDIILQARVLAGAVSNESIFDFLRRLPPGISSREDLDKGLQMERTAWERTE
jgi:hypothetical protein